MQTKTIETLRQKVTIAFDEALGNVIDKVAEILDANTTENENDENQTAETQMTIGPKILIAYKTPGTFDIEVRIPAKRTVQAVGLSIMDFEVDENGQEIDDGDDLPGITEEA